MALINEHRPDNLDDIYENEDTVKALKKVLKRERKKLPHAYLFTGPSGCGKTTIGRIVASELGSSGMDLSEVDSGDFRGIDMVRGIRDRMNMKPVSSDCRVWIIDECHKMTNDAQNALLKALEEPPAHVFFILCTTNPEKLLKTIHTRCMTFTVESIAVPKIAKLIKEVADKEEKEVPRDVIKQIARDSLGSPRAALSILDKIIDLDEEEMLSAAEQIAEKENQVIELINALMGGKSWDAVSKILKGLAKEDAESVRRQIMGYCSAVMLSGKRADQAYLVLDSYAGRPTYDVGHAALVLAAYEALND